MRHHLYFILSLTLVLFSACSKDDDASDSLPYNNDTLLGSYSLTALESEETITERVQDFDVVTKTKKVGDTFDARVTFNDDNTVSYRGTFRIVETKTQNGQSIEKTYIIVWDNERKDYIVDGGRQTLKIDGILFNVKRYSATGFELEHHELIEKANGTQEERKIRLSLKR